MSRISETVDTYRGREEPKLTAWLDDGRRTSVYFDCSRGSFRTKAEAYIEARRRQGDTLQIPQARRLVDLLTGDREVEVEARKYLMTDAEAKVSRRYEVFLGRELEAEIPVAVGFSTWRLDIYDPETGHAIESKAKVGSQEIQNAIGELMIKPQRLDTSRPVTFMAVLFGYGSGKAVYEDVAEDMKALGIFIIQEQSDGSFTDNADGRFLA